MLHKQNYLDLTQNLNIILKKQMRLADPTVSNEEDELIQPPFKRFKR
jgi:hypothetical protein